MPQNKVAAIEGFLDGLADLRQAAKEDSLKMIAALPLEILLDEAALAEYMQEMVIEISRKYLVNDSGRVPADTAKLIDNYVSKMAVIQDD